MMHLKNELDLFYRCVRTRNNLSSKWHEIETMLNLLNVYQNEKNGVIYYFKKRKLISKLLLALWNFNGRKLLDEKGLANSNLKKSYYEDGFIKSYIDKEIQTMPQYPIKETMELVQFFEQKNSKAFELTIAFMTSLIGGIVGALVTSLTSLSK